MLKVEIDGREVEIPHGSTVMDAAHKLGIFVPHFCYHKKLSIAANCRMCLVEVEKAPKPLPACATPVTDGMKVKTASANAKKAQNAVMEFLLINHPLDCPICDQGGECQLQDLAVGYGGSASRFQEEKRVVLHKDIGPLVAAEEMSRCIQCTRCVRFGQEVAGVMELGMIGRGEHSEIVAFVGKSVDSELSGNMIDLCPVGALTSKPFRYSARTWELARRKSVSPHDGLGSNLVVQVKQNKVMRVLPLENEAINECWLSDKERFSYEALNSEERLAQPMVKRNGRWEQTDWQTALEFAVKGLKDFGVLGSPHSTLEELYLAGKLGAPADFRLRHSDFSGDGKRAGIPWLGMPLTELASLDRVLVVGSFLRKDHPLIAQRLRQAAKRGLQVHVLHSVDDDWLMPVKSKKIVAPSELLNGFESFREILKTGKNSAILLGNFAQQHPQAAAIHAAAQAIGVKVGFLGEAANSVGGYVAGLPVAGGLPEVARRKSLILMGLDPRLDLADPKIVEGRNFIVNLTSFNADVGDVLLPIAPFTETPGAFVSTEGRVQSFHAAVRPLGDTRPAWKVLRVLGTMLGLPGFEFETIEQVREAALGGRDVQGLLSNKIDFSSKEQGSAASGLQRIADVPIYFADPLARRSPPLQRTRDAQAPRAWMNAKLMQKLGVQAGGLVLVRKDGGEAGLAVALDDKLPDECVRIAAGHPASAALGSPFGTLTLEKITSRQVA